MGSQNLKNGPRDPDHAYLRVDCHPKATLDIAYLCSEFDNSNVSLSGDMIVACKI